MGDYGDAMLRNQNSAVQARTKTQNRANVMQLKLIGQSHPTGLTANLLKLFEPRPPLEYKPPPEKRKCPPYTGIAQFVSNFAEPGDPEYVLPVTKSETPAERRSRIHQIRLEEGAKKLAEELEKYDPNNDPNISGDPYKTLFVARLNYETTESRIKREFEAYGPIKRSHGMIKVANLDSDKGYRSRTPESPMNVRLVTDKETNKPRGYAFIEYMHTRDMKAAYKQADGKKIDNRRVLVDVERGRTVPNWRPRRLGGGLGTARIGPDDGSLRNVGREQVQSGGISRSEEPREERDREKSRERTRDRDRERERERSRELSHERPKDRDRRDDRHHRERDRDRGRERERERTRDRRDRDRDRERKRDKDREYETVNDRDRGRSHDPREREVYDGEEQGRGHYYHHGASEYDRYKESDRYDQMDEEDNYGYDQDRDYRRADRSLSREY